MPKAPRTLDLCYVPPSDSFACRISNPLDAYIREYLEFALFLPWFPQADVLGSDHRDIDFASTENSDQSIRIFFSFAMLPTRKNNKRIGSSRSFLA